MDFNWISWKQRLKESELRVVLSEIRLILGISTRR